MIEAISEIINEIETSVQNIAAQSLEHVLIFFFLTIRIIIDFN
jgi:hypothetical protein